MGRLWRKEISSMVMGGRLMGSRCVAIEPQQWIDGINHPEWGQEEFQNFRTTTGLAVHLLLSLAL